MQEQTGLEPGAAARPLTRHARSYVGSRLRRDQRREPFLLAREPPKALQLGWVGGGDGRITSTPREDGSQGEGIRNEPKCPRIHLGLIRPRGRATGPLRSLR